MPNAKLEIIVSKINALERFTWIKKWGNCERNLQKLEGNFTTPKHGFYDYDNLRLKSKLNHVIECGCELQPFIWL
jgi:hypothetical protein